MGAALAQACLDRGHEVLVISGPVQVTYPEQAQLIQVVTTSELEAAVQSEFPRCDGIIGAAAPCDFTPVAWQDSKIKKTGEGLTITFTETNDILAAASKSKRPDQWSVGFALETHNGFENAQKKLREKELNFIVLNGPDAMNSTTNKVRIISREKVEAEASGSKLEVAQSILSFIDVAIQDEF